MPCFFRILRFFRADSATHAAAQPLGWTLLFAALFPREGGVFQNKMKTPHFPRELLFRGERVQTIWRQTMNIYEETTQRILKQLDEGVIPWRKTWASGLPASLSTGREYRGINILILSTAGYSSRYWVTFREALRLGGNVRKGEKATPIIYWHWRTPEELAKLQERSGKADLAPCVPFTSAVFNLDQVDGVPRPEATQEFNHVRRLELADYLLDVMPDKPEIVHSLSDEPSYRSREDRVTLPHLSQFENADEYYATLFHELTHASGHERRLNRIVEQEGDAIERYSFEELVAEFGAAFLCGFAGINNAGTEALAASYIHGWAEKLRNDHRLVMRAASAAQRAADYIRGKVVTDAKPSTEEEQRPAAETHLAA